MRIAKTIDPATLRAVLTAEFASGARLEMVFEDGSRHRIGKGLDDTALRALVQAAGPDCGARLELVFPQRARN